MGMSVEECKAKCKSVVSGSDTKVASAEATSEIKAKGTTKCCAAKKSCVKKQ